MQEFDLLRHVYGANARLDDRVVIPPGDDLAMVRVGDGLVLVGVDQVVGGRHFEPARTPLDRIAHKAIARSLSDVAAMAARPSCALVAITLPPTFGQDRASALFDAMRDTAQQLGCPLVGGDIAFHDDPAHPLVCAVTVLAEPGPTPPVTRGGARAGDHLYVTGALGGSLGPDGQGRHLSFLPRIDAALELAATLGDRLHAMIDLSDGLGRDAAHLAESSHVQMRLEAALLPTHDGLDWRRAAGDGEDYELLFAASGEVPGTAAGVNVTRIGTVREPPVGDDRRVVILDGDQEWTADELGWQHES